MNLYSGYWVALKKLLSENSVSLERPWLNELQEVPELTTRQELLESLARCIDVCGDRALALRLGQSLQIMSLGLLGLAVINCQTVAQVARLLVRHSPLRSSGARLRLREENAALKLSFIEHWPPVSAYPFLAHELFFSSVISAMRRLVPEPLEGMHLELAGAGHQSAEAYSKMLGIPVVTNQDMNQLVITPELAETELAAGGDVSANLQMRLYDGLLKQSAPETGFAGSVRSILLRMIGQPVDARTIAGKLNMSERTLRRRLDDEKTSLREIRHNLLKQVACRYLESTELSVAEIGDMLGYSEYTNFRRVFLRWTGQSPSSYRHFKRRT